MVNSRKTYRATMSQVATWSATAPVAGATWVHLPVIGAPEPKYDVELTNAQRANANAASSMELFKRKGIFQYPLETQFFTGTLGIDGALGDGAISSYFLESLWDSYWGGVGAHAFAGTTCTGVGTGKSSDLTVGSTANCVAGQCILVAFAATGTWEIAAIEKVVDGTHLTLDHDLTTQPANLDVVYGGHTYMVTRGQRTKADYILVEKAAGETGAHSILGGPCQVMNASLEGLAAGGDLRIKMMIEGQTWIQSGTGHTVSTALAPTTFTKNAFTGAPIVARGGQVRINGTAVCMAEGKVDFNVMHEWLQCSSGVMGRDNPMVVGCEAPTITVVEPYLAARKVAEEAQSGFPVLLSHSVGTTAAAAARGSMAVFMPNAQVIAPEGPYSANTLGTSSTFVGRDPAESSDAVIAAQLTQPIYFTLFGGN